MSKTGVFEFLVINNNVMVINYSLFCKFSRGVLSTNFGYNCKFTLLHDQY